jgi:hypothetical protein
VEVGAGRTRPSGKRKGKADGWRLAAAAASF